MIVLFISVCGIVIKCIDAQWCEVVNPVILRGLVTAGGVEMLFELTGFIKIFGQRYKSDEHED